MAEESISELAPPTQIRDQVDSVLMQRPSLSNCQLDLSFLSNGEDGGRRNSGHKSPRAILRQMTLQSTTSTPQVRSRASTFTNDSSFAQRSLLQHARSFMPDLQGDGNLETDSDLEEELQEAAEELREFINLWPRASLTFKDVSFSISDPNNSGKPLRILSPISGHVEPGTMVAIMGPSGCGKTTLLDILSQKKTLPHEGTILLNGREPDKFFTRLTSYVAQADYGSGHETVTEALRFVSKLKADCTMMDGKTAEQEREDHIKFLLDILGLSKVADTPVGDEKRRGISGGQKRRLALAKGLVTGPAIAFLDEPTSGLSSTDAEQAVKALRSISKLFAITIITVIHQPKESVFQMFDHLILLTEEGKCAYNGPVDEVPDHFAGAGVPIPPHVNIADHVLDVVSRGHVDSDPDCLVGYYGNIMRPAIESSISKVPEGQTLREVVQKTNTKRDNSRFVASWWQQFQILLHRDARVFIRDYKEFITVLMNTSIVGILFGLVYLDVWDDGDISTKLQYQFSFLFVVMLTASYATLNFMPVMMRERLIFLTERSEGLYYVGPYLASKLIISTFSTFLETLVLVSTCYFMSGFPAGDFVFVFFIIYVTYSATDAIVVFITSMSPNMKVANAATGHVLGILSIFNGFTSNTVASPTGISWLNFLSPFYYGFQAMVVHFYPPEIAEDKFGFNLEWGIHGSVAILVSMCVLFRGLEYYALRYKNQIIR